MCVNDPVSKVKWEYPKRRLLFSGTVVKGKFVPDEQKPIAEGSFYIPYSKISEKRSWATREALPVVEALGEIFDEAKLTVFDLADDKLQ